MNTSARNATAIVRPSSPPNHAVGLYSDIMRTPKPRLLITAVVSDARPSWTVAVSIAASVVAPAATSRRYRLMKWIVSSSTTPSATLATITVAMFIEMPRKPMTPRTASTGSTFGAIVNRPKRADRKTMKITPKTVKNAVPKLLICDDTR